MVSPDHASIYWQRVLISEGCWLWVGSINHATGYGLVSVPVPEVGRRTVTMGAHRFAYELLVGPIPEGLEIDHLCFNTECVRPDHLEPVTHAENMRRSREAGRLGRPCAVRCKRGHVLTGDNLYHYRTANGRTARFCRECGRLRQQASRASRRSAA